MQTMTRSNDHDPPAPVNLILLAARTVLVIDAPSALHYLKPCPGRQAVVLTQMKMLSRTMIASVRPDVIIGPLICAHWDIVDLGVALENLGYCGDIFAMTRPLPRAELVIREVSAVCPALTVRLLEVA